MLFIIVTLFWILMYWASLFCQVSGNRLCWGAPCQEYLDRLEWSKGLALVSLFIDYFNRKSLRKPNLPLGLGGKAIGDTYFAFVK